ncbi:MAG TPA: hypothetical protein VKV28_02755 [Candidatus Binataceae bacterium]|nr:hypothetical protein [Candidatus Binataceae bacterium]
MQAKQPFTLLQNLTRLLLALSLVSVALLPSERTGVRMLCSPRGVAVTTASKCVCEDCANTVSNTDFANARARLMPIGEILSRPPLILRPRPEPGLFANPIDLPRLARRMAPPGADNAPFTSLPIL